MEMPSLTALAVKHRQIELAEPFGVAEDVYLGDLPAADREGHELFRCCETLKFQA